MAQFISNYCLMKACVKIIIDCLLSLASSRAIGYITNHLKVKVKVNVLKSNTFE
jgi:hypothetical protein